MLSYDAAMLKNGISSFSKQYGHTPYIKYVSIGRLSGIFSSYCCNVWGWCRSYPKPTTKKTGIQRSSIG